MCAALDWFGYLLWTTGKRSEPAQTQATAYCMCLSDNFSVEQPTPIAGTLFSDNVSKLNEKFFTGNRLK